MRYNVMNFYRTCMAMAVFGLMTNATFAAASRQMTVTNKSSQFSTSVSENSKTATDASTNALADRVRQQRAAMDSASASAAASGASAAALSGGGNACDKNLRACMQEKCGSDFTKCKGDGDTIWGDKMDSCRRDLPCSGSEYAQFAAEIKADRDMNARLASYNAILDCGNRYNECIITQCGVTYNKCLGKPAGDKAIASCDKIAKECTQQDSGMAARTMEVFGTLRQAAEKQVKDDEQRLYTLRDNMRTICARLGAMFDERSLDCVYTVEFYAGDSSTLMASKKSYAGGVFDCTPNWFGIDVTTFKENAYRLTRSQTSATSALLGAGLGVATGAATSGMLNRAIDTQKAKNALNKAKDENGDADSKKAKAEERCAKKKNGKTSVKQNKLGMWVCYNPSTGEEDATDSDKKTDREEKAKERCAKKKNGKTAAKKNKLGMWVCYDPKTGAEETEAETKAAEENKPEEIEEEEAEGDTNSIAPEDENPDEIECEEGGGAWKNGKCDCSGAADAKVCGILTGQISLLQQDGTGDQAPAKTQGETQTDTSGDTTKQATNDDKGETTSETADSGSDGATGK